MKPVIYECEPMGLNSSLEAVAVHYFCNDACRGAWPIPYYTPVEIGADDEWIDGSVCETCNAPLTRDSEALPDVSIESRLLHALYVHNWNPRAYSGRGMMGKQCVAVSLESESMLFRLGRTLPVDVDAPHVDQLGKGIIAYWPNYEWPKDAQ